MQRHCRLAPAASGQIYKATLTASVTGVEVTFPLALTGTGGSAFSWSPTTSKGTYNYGTVSADGKVSQAFTLTNSGIRSSGPLTVTLPRTGAFVIVKGQDGCTGASLAPNTSCNVTVAFAPGRVGQAYSAKLTANGGRAVLASLSLTGMGGPRVVLSWSPTTSPGTYNYGTVNLGQTLSQAFILTNSGSTSTSRLNLTLRGSTVFQRVKSSCSSLAPNTSCSVAVAFAPAASGQSYSATLTATSSSPAATASLTLTGTGGAKASPAIATSPGAGGPPGTTVTDTATLTGGSAPGGSIEFRLYGPSTAADCSGTPVDDETVTVIKGNTSYTTPTGATLTQALLVDRQLRRRCQQQPGRHQLRRRTGGHQQGVPAIATTAGAGGPPGATVIDIAALTGDPPPAGRSSSGCTAPARPRTAPAPRSMTRR